MPPLDARAPASLRRLHALNESLEFALSSLALYQRTAEWDAVKRAVESSSQTTLTLEDLQQMMWLAPSAYAVVWSRRPPSRKRARAAATSDRDDRDADDEPVLLLRRQRVTSPTPNGADDAPSPQPSETLADRIAFFTTRVNAFITDHIQPNASDDEIVAALANVEIGKAALPEKDTTSVQQQHHERLKQIATKNERDVSSVELAAALAAPVPEDLQTLPKWLVDKVRTQEQHSKKAAQRTDAMQRQRLYTTLPQLSDQVQSLVLVQRRHVFLLRDMVRQLAIKAPIRDQIEEQIHLLESMVPFWVTVFFSDGKEFVKVARGHKYNAVKAALRKAIATMA